MMKSVVGPEFAKTADDGRRIDSIFKLGNTVMLSATSVSFRADPHPDEATRWMAVERMEYDNDRIAQTTGRSGSSPKRDTLNAQRRLGERHAGPRRPLRPGRAPV